MPCQELSWPAPQCGFQGTCVENLVNETSICKCDNGWSQLPELVYFNDDVPLSSFPCGHNTTFLNVLYSVCLFLSAVVVILQISIIKSTKQLKKAAIPILVHMLLITACVLRLSNPSESLLGISVAFSFFIGMVFGLLHVTIALFNAKYLSYLESKLGSVLSSDVSHLKKRIQFSVKSINYFLVLDVLVSQLFWISALFDSRSDAKIVIRCVFIWYGFRNAFNMVLIASTMTFTVMDLKKLVELNRDLNDRRSSTTAGDTFVLWAKRKIPDIVYMRNSIITSTSFTLLCFHLPSIFSDWGLQNAKYFVVILFMLYCLNDMFLILLKRKKMLQDQISSQSKSSVESSASTSNTPSKFDSSRLKSTNTNTEMSIANASGELSI